MFLLAKTKSVNRYFDLYFMCVISSLTHSVNDLLNGVEADDARAFLVGSSIPWFALYGRQMDSHCIPSIQETNNNKHRLCPN